MPWSKNYEPFGQEAETKSGKVFQIVFPEPLRPREQWTTLTCINEGMRDFQLRQCIFAYHNGRGMRWQRDEKLAHYAKENA